MKQLPHALQFLLVLIVFFLSTPDVMAQKIKVKKAKGNTALIESSVPLEEGQSYELQSSPVSAEVTYASAGFKSRQNSLMLGASFSTLKGSSVQENHFSFQGRYGWNFSILEFGAVGEATYSDVGAGPNTDFAIGGYFDYNLITNRDGRPFIYGPFALVSFGSTQFAAGGSAGKFNVNVGGFFSYFFGKGATALRVEGFVDHSQITASTGQTSLTGFGSRGLMVFYF